MMHHRLYFYSLAVFGLLGGRTAFAADPAAAEALFQKGVAEMDAGHLDAACPALAESQRLDPRPGTLCALAECEAKAGRIATASSLYTDYLRQYEAMSPPHKNKHAERAKAARAQREALAAEVPQLALVLPPEAPAGLRILRDGVEITAASLDMALPVDPGEHVIVTQAPGGPLHEDRVRVSPGEMMTVELAVEEAPPARDKPKPVVVKRVAARPAPAAVKERGAWMRPAAYAFGGVGLAGFAAGASMGIAVLKMSRDIAEDCPSKQCKTREAKGMVDRANDYATASTIAIPAGLGLLGAGLSLFLLSKGSEGSHPEKPGVRFGSVEVGPGSAAAVVRGVF